LGSNFAFWFFKWERFHKKLRNACEKLCVKNIMVVELEVSKEVVEVREVEFESYVEPAVESILGSVCEVVLYLVREGKNALKETLSHKQLLRSRKVWLVEIVAWGN